MLILIVAIQQFSDKRLSSVVPVFRANLLGFSEHFQVAFLDPKGAVAQALDLIGVV